MWKEDLVLSAADLLAELPMERLIPRHMMSLSKVPLEAIKAPRGQMEGSFERAMAIQAAISIKYQSTINQQPQNVIKNGCDPPEIVRRSLESMKPAALVASPLKAFSKETTTGMSAPPMGSTMLTPRKPHRAVLANKQAVPYPEAKVAGFRKKPEPPGSRYNFRFGTPNSMT